MLHLWFDPFKEIGLKNDTVFGHKVKKHTGTFPDLRKTKVALIGIRGEETDAVRSFLYNYEIPLGLSHEVADLGNVKKTNVDFLIPVFHELIQSGILPIVLGSDAETATALFLAYKEAKKVVNVVSVDSQPDVSEEFYKKLLNPQHPILFHFGLLGYHTHQTPVSFVDKLQKKSHEAIRYGRSKTAIEEVEPMIRDADFISIHLRALSASYSPGVSNQSPAGYTVEEACLLARYAGMSDKVTAFGVFGYEKYLDIANLTAQTLAQMVWYFLDGYINRKNDYPATKDGMLEYIAEFGEEKSTQPITFWKSPRSGRWWVQVALESTSKLQRHYLVPCSFSDYQMASRGEISDRVLLAISRF